MAFATSQFVREQGSHMKVYLAARYHRLGELRRYADELQRMGHSVTSRWLKANSPASGSLDEPEWAELAQHDVEDAMAADAVVLFAEGERGGGGGRHVEFGIGLGLGKRLIVVGRAEHLFHTLPAVEVYRDWEAAISAL